APAAGRGRVVKLAPANASRWRGQPGHYEAWHLSVVDPASSASAWVRYSFQAPEGEAAEGRVAELWLAGRLPDGESYARRQTYAIEEFHTGAGGFPVLLAGSELELHRAHGTMADAAWDLSWQPSGEPIAYPAAARLGRAELVTAQPALRASGTITVGERSMQAASWPGHQAHAWGSRHADSWARAHCSAFAAAGDHVDVVTRRSRSPVGLSPAVTTASLRAEGETHRSGGAALGLVADVEYSPDRYVFAVRGPRARIEGEVHAPVDQLLGVTYWDPDGDRVYCYHTERADVQARLLRRRRGRWHTAVELSAAGCCSYEYASRTPVQGIEVVL
ncbi:MAG: hypothetical protein ACTHNU_01700, partial [Gaiellales bacterium]